MAWVSLDEGDHQAATFWTYVVAALHKAAPEVGTAQLPLLQSGQPPTRQLLAALVNSIGDQAVDLDLVLDDYHLADGPEVAEGMTYLLDHLPPNLHVVITTRADPDLPLARLRARGELVEMRARDLRFTEDETATYLADIGGLSLASASVATLAERTEGWAAALQLATLSMTGRDDADDFVAGFAGDDRFVVDYLADEVLARQPPELREFLLRTCVLDRFTASLCDSVTDAPGSRAMIEALDRANLFIVPLDERRRWYRYHHLFADVLRTHLEADHPGLAPRLHARASIWFARFGDTVAAVRHALAAGELDRAADLVEAAVPELGRQRSEATLRAWADDFPAEVVRRRPLLALGLVGGFMQHNEFGPGEEMLREVERWLPAIRTRLGLPPDERDAATPHAPTVGELVTVDDQLLARVPATVEMYRAALALVHGDPTATIQHAERTLAEAQPDDHLSRGAAAALSGLACWTSGGLEPAHAWYSRSVAHLLAAGHVADVVGCTIAMADLRIAQGRLAEALAAYDEGLRLAGGDGVPLRGAPDMHTGIAEVALERGDVETARHHPLAAQELGEPLGLGQNPYRLRAGSALLAETEGYLTTARELLVDAQRVYLGDFSPDVRPLHARIARVDLAGGDLGAALLWAQEHDIRADQELSYAREFEHVTLAEVLLAEHLASADPAALLAARALLDQLLGQADEGGRTATVLEVLVLQALAAWVGGEPATACSALQHALALGAVEGHVRVFARHGQALAGLLDAVADAVAPSAYLERIRAGARPGPAVVDRSPGVAHTRRAEGLVEPLSPRELEVLRLLASELDGPDIARHLVVSLNTLRTHTKNIYAKLGVNSRRAALRRAHDLGLLGR